MIPCNRRNPGAVIIWRPPGGSDVRVAARVKTPQQLWQPGTAHKAQRGTAGHDMAHRLVAAARRLERLLQRGMRKGALDPLWVSEGGLLGVSLWMLMAVLVILGVLVGVWMCGCLYVVFGITERKMFVIIAFVMFFPSVLMGPAVFASSRPCLLIMLCEWLWFFPAFIVRTR